VTVNRTRILLAEDDPVNQLITSHLLADLGFEVDLADNGEEAVEKARAGGHALVMMDLNMPIMDGVEATRLIRQIPELQGLVILALTASVFEDDRQRCEQAGMNGHLSKPIDPVQMQAALGRWLGA
jgi:two-component system sensor histidine kinase/response regulator